MPIDYKKISDDAETSLQDFVQGQQARSLKDIAGTRTRVETARSPLFQAAMGLGNDPGAFQEHAGLVQARLGGNLNAALGQRKLQESRSALGTRYNDMVRRGLDRNMRLDSAKDYARQTLQQNMSQQQQAAELQRKIEQQRLRSDESESFSQQGLAQEQAFAPSTNDMYQQAMYRALFGLVGSGATLGVNAYMNKGAPQPTPMSPGGYGGTGQTYAGLLNQQFGAQDQYNSLQPYMPNLGVNRRY